MAIASTPFITKAPDKLSGRTTPIAILPMTFKHAHIWQFSIQPHIQKDPTRADRIWAWPLFHSIFPLVQRTKGYRCNGLTTLVPNTDGYAVPAAMSLFIEQYPHLPAGTDKKAVFIWFLCTAPDNALTAMDVPSRPSLGRICLDTAMVASHNLGLEGRIGLYCAQEGGSRLEDYYSKKCKLIQISKGAPVSVNRANDGRFFYTDETRAALLIAEHMPLR